MTALPAGLVQAARGGDQDALVRLLALAQPDIRRYAQRTCRVPGDVDDAVQEALWLVTRRVGALRSIGAFPAWAFAIVRRACLRLARAGLDPAARAEAYAAQRIVACPAPELRIDLANAIQSLPPHYRAVVLLRDVEERTIDEIAAQLGASREAVKARLRRARDLLRECLLRGP